MKAPRVTQITFHDFARSINSNPKVKASLKPEFEKIGLQNKPINATTVEKLFLSIPDFQGKSVKEILRIIRKKLALQVRTLNLRTETTLSQLEAKQGEYQKIQRYRYFAQKKHF